MQTLAVKSKRVREEREREKENNKTTFQFNWLICARFIIA